MTQVSDVALRLRDIRQRSGFSVRGFAEALGMTAGGYKHYEDRYKRPFFPRDFVEDLLHVLVPRGFNPTELLALAGEDADPAGAAESHPVAAVEGKALIPLYDVAASAGPGTYVDSYEPIATSLALPEDYLRRITRARRDDLAIISVKGDSMWPTLKDDDIVLLDLSKRSTAFDGLFVLRFRDALHVKRLGRGSRPDLVAIISDNKDYPTQEYPADDVQVVGKVLWVGGKV
ncbi:S24 family peptidase [Rubellimicrobium aerolatum]|uniref:S24 family peptidase n=1 Tax=Rubellimicrobium aerolatum TaxID=490979 RepID=A0ABW0SF56_9RHOB|nr:S24 family peptidase [Rubellimicrobium aerolatum]MBP1806484.1 phage repressor protein C with HTH and peptisase S24 domain [Rubellimicrobium aerolatum]